MRIIWQKSVDTAEKIACVQTSPISLRLHAGNRKERLHIRKLAKFESDTFAFAKVRCFAGLAPPPPPPPPPTIETSVKFRHFAELYCRSCQQITLKPGKLTSFKAFFFSGVDGFSPTDSCQKLKSHGRVYLVKHLAKLPLSGRCDYEKT